MLTKTDINELEEIKQLVAEATPFDTKTGKFLRSKTGLLILKSEGIPVSKNHLMFLSAIEIIHNASLLHDDVIDNEDTRRGEPNIKSRSGSKTSILYGNLLMIKAFKIINSLKNPKLLDIITSTIEKMCKGELLQQSQTGKIPKLDEYLQKTELKTASLFEGMIAGLTELSDNMIDERLKEFGKNYGIAFQIKNDLDNVTGNGTDKQNGIYTAPYIFSDGEKIDKKSLEKTLSLIDNYIVRATALLSEIKESIYKAELIGVVKCLKE